MKYIFNVIALTLLLIMPLASYAQERELTVAVLAYEVSGDNKTLTERLKEAVANPDALDQNTLGKEFAALMTEQLSATFSLSLVERERLDEIVSELELGISGTVDPESAARIGELVGAQVIITGRIFPVKNNLIIVSKILSVETGRVYGETVTLPQRGSLTEVAIEMAAKVATTISNKSDKLLPNVEEEIETVDKLRFMLRDYDTSTFPVVSVAIEEEHNGENGIDPAAETEIALILQQLGFKIVDPLTTTEPADIEITGEALSEFGLRKGNLVSSKARVEIKAVERLSGEIIHIDREVDVAVDLSVAIAGRMAVQNAAEAMAERLVPKLVANAKKSAVIEDDVPAE